MNAEAIRGGTEKESIEAEETETAWRHEGGDADTSSVSEMWRSKDTAPRLSDVRDVP